MGLTFLGGLLVLFSQGKVKEKYRGQNKSARGVTAETTPALSVKQENRFLFFAFFATKAIQKSSSPGSLCFRIMTSTSDGLESGDIAQDIQTVLVDSANFPTDIRQVDRLRWKIRQHDDGMQMIEFGSGRVIRLIDDQFDDEVSFFSVHRSEILVRAGN